MEENLPDKVTVVFQRAKDLPGYWWVHSPEMPGVVTQGKNLSDAIGMFQDAYELMAEEDLEEER